MARGQKESNELKKVTVRIFASDHSVLVSAYPSLGHNEIIRRLVRKHCRQLEDRISSQAPNLEVFLDERIADNTQPQRSPTAKRSDSSGQADEEVCGTVD